MFLRFYKSPENVTRDMAKQFANEVMAQKKNVSPAQIQGFFMFHKNDPEKVIKNITGIWEVS